MSVRKQVRLLVVDDQSEFFEHVKEHAQMYHSNYNIEVAHADTGSEAIQLSNNWHPSVVLIDLHLLDMNGTDVLRRLIAHGSPVVVVSRDMNADIAAAASDNGAIGYMPKSENPDDIETLIEMLGSVSVLTGPEH